MARTCILRAHFLFADAVSSFSGVTFVLFLGFCFVLVFVLMLSLKPRPFVQPFFDIIDDCSGVKGRKGQHEVRLTIKDEIVKKAGKDGLAIECIITRLLKARISIKSNCVTFVVAYALTKKEPEEQKANYMAALNSTVASVPARDYVAVLADANARTGKRDEGGGEAGSKVLGAYGRDVLNENGKLLLFCLQKTTSSLF